MRQDHPELLTTLRDVAATAVTLLDTFAQIRRERTAQPPPAAPPPAPHVDEAPTDTSAPRANRDYAPDPPPTAAESPDPPILLTALRREAESPSIESLRRRLMDTSRRIGTREDAITQYWASARDLTDSINDRLFMIAELASIAIEEDGLRTLPLLDALLERIHDEFRDQTGPFAAAPDIGLVR